MCFIFNKDQYHIKFSLMSLNLAFCTPHTIHSDQLLKDGGAGGGGGEARAAGAAAQPGPAAGAGGTRPPPAQAGYHPAGPLIGSR